MSPYISIAIIALISFFLIRRGYSGWKLPKEPFPKDWRIILAGDVSFYNSLSAAEKIRFEFKVQEFLLNCRITGIETRVDTTDKILVASSAVIPIFGFGDWKNNIQYHG